MRKRSEGGGSFFRDYNLEPRMNPKTGIIHLVDSDNGETLCGNEPSKIVKKDRRANRKCKVCRNISHENNLGW